VITLAYISGIFLIFLRPGDEPRLEREASDFEIIIGAMSVVNRLCQIAIRNLE
jgi:hypothetical protein